MSRQSWTGARAARGSRKRRRGGKARSAPPSDAARCQAGLWSGVTASGVGIQLCALRDGRSSFQCRKRHKTDPSDRTDHWLAASSLRKYFCRPANLRRAWRLSSPPGPVSSQPAASDTKIRSSKVARPRTLRCATVNCLLNRSC